MSKARPPKEDKGGINRRKQPRVEADLLVRFSDETGTYLEECIGNISKGGIFVETLKPRPLKEILDLFLVFPKAGEEIAVQAEVVHVCTQADDSDDGGTSVGMGLRFTMVEPKQKDALKNFIESLLQTRGQGSREHSRVYAPKQVLVRFRSRDDFRAQDMPNISRGGLYFETDEELTLFDIVDLKLEGPDIDAEIVLPAEVVHIRRAQTDSGRKRGVGVKFIQMDEARQKVVDEFIRSILEAQQL